MTKILEVKDLTYTYKTKTSLFFNDSVFELGPISFDIHLGETIAIIGNNGSGKTLIAKLLAGVLKPTSGTIDFRAPSDFDQFIQPQPSSQDKCAQKVDVQISEHASTKISKHPQATLATATQDINTKGTSSTKKTNSHPIRLILQHSASSMNPALSVGTMMHNTLQLNTTMDETQRRQKIEDTLRVVGLLPDHYYYYKHMFSDGQQQRVALARALLLDPQIIVADEPFAALDPSVRSQTVNLIIKLQQELGLGFVFISHNIGIVRHMSDRVLVMEDGKIIEQGLTEEVFRNPQQSLTQKLIQSHFNLVERHLSML